MERTALVITWALAACGGAAPSQPVAAPLVPAPSAKPASECDKVLAERADPTREVLDRLAALCEAALTAGVGLVGLSD